MAYNVALKVAMVERGVKQKDLAAYLGIHKSRLSRIVNGDMEASDHEKRLIAKMLRKPATELFGKAAA